MLSLYELLRSKISSLRPVRTAYRRGLACTALIAATYVVQTVTAVSRRNEAASNIYVYASTLFWCGTSIILLEREPHRRWLARFHVAGAACEAIIALSSKLPLYVSAIRLALVATAFCSTFTRTRPHSKTAPQNAASHPERKAVEPKDWIGYVRSLAIIVPNDGATRAWFAALLLSMGAKRVLILLIPRQLGLVTESLGGVARSGRIPVLQLVIWAVLQSCEALASLVQSRAETRIAQASQVKLTSMAFEHVMSLSMDFHTSKSSGEVARAIEQGSQLSQLIDTAATLVPVALDFVIAVAYISAYFDATLGCIVLATAMLSSYVSYRGNSGTIERQTAVAESTRHETQTLYDSLSNWQTVAHHNRQDYESRRYRRCVEASAGAKSRFADLFEYVSAAETGIMQLGLLACASIVAMRVAAGTASLSSFVFLISYWGTIRSPMMLFAYKIRETAQILVDAEWLHRLLSTPASVRDREGAQDLYVRGGARVEFRNVSFSYGPEWPILRDVSFTAAPGQTVALVGETGSGKSTVLKLLHRFYDATDGAVLINGQDVRDVTVSSLRDSLGAVPQGPSVLDLTLMENMLYARPGATEEETIAACKAARIHDQIVKFPEGYSTRLGERGARLSGGELQRLAIARVMLRRPAMVVLDEATSAVDSNTEALIQDAVRALSVGRTVFMVAHRLSTVVGADMILVMNGGRVEESGTHTELLRRKGRYAKLWELQANSID